MHGTVESGWEPVRDAFAANFAHHGEVGAAVCVLHHGRTVVDLWGGTADPETGRPWSASTAAVMFSATKGIAAVTAHRLVERGVLDLSVPVATMWPAFGAAGKADVTLGDAMAHRAGVPVVDALLTLDDVLAWDAVVDAVAAQVPLWAPGTDHGYHVRTFGWIIGEVVRRVTGRSLGRLVADELAAPLAAEVWIGLPEAEEARLAPIIPPPPLPPDAAAAMEAFAGPGTLLGRALSGPSNLFGYNDMWNRRDLHAAEMPSSNGIATARALARIYGAAVGEVDGVRLLEPATVEAACRQRSDGPDRVLTVPTRFGAGFMLPPALGPTGPRAFGHPGAGGSLGFADPEAELGFGYVMNQMQLGVTGDVRSQGLVQAAYSCI